MKLLTKYQYVSVHILSIHCENRRLFASLTLPFLDPSLEGGLGLVQPSAGYPRLEEVIEETIHHWTQKHYQLAAGEHE